MAQRIETKAKRRLEELKTLISERLREALDNKDGGWSQSQLAYMSGMKVAYVNRVLKMNANMTLESIATLEAALDMKLIERPQGFDTLSSRGLTGVIKAELE